MEDSTKRYEELVEKMIASNDPEKMKVLRCASEYGFAQLNATHPKLAQRWLDKLEAASWNNYLSQAEADEIVATFINQNGTRGPKWPFPAFTQAVEAFDGKMCDAPFYNKYALWVTANMLYSDHAATISTLAPESELPQVFYKLAVEKLKDVDRPNFVRKYFDI